MPLTVGVRSSLRALICWSSLSLGKMVWRGLRLLALLEVIDNHVLVEVFAASRRDRRRLEVAGRAGRQQAIEFGAVGLGNSKTLAHEDAAVVERVHLAAAVDAQQHDGAAG